MLAEQVSSNWLFGQGVALATSACASTGHGRPPNLAFSKLLFERLLDCGRKEAKGATWVRRVAAGIPPVAMGRLADIALSTGKDFWGHLAKPLRDEHDAMNWRDNRSRVAGAKLVADRLIDGHLSASQLARTAAVELGYGARADKGGWRNPSVVDEIGTLQSGLRDQRRTYGRLAAVRSFRDAMGKSTPSGWTGVESALLQRLLCWLPTSYGASKAADAGHLLPLGLDLCPGDGAPVRIVATPRQIEGEAARWLAEFEISVVRAREAAIDLWLWRFPFQRPATRRMIAEVTVSVDISLLDAIGEACVLPNNATLSPEISGPSCEAYLALVIFGRLIGSRRAESAIATGSLVPPREVARDRGAEWRVGFIGCEGAKFDAADGQLFDRMVFPVDAPPGRRGRTAVLLGDYLWHFADHVFGDEGRKHRWIRCPDLVADLKEGRWDKGPETEVRLRDIRDRLRNAGPLCWLDDTDPMHVAWSLYRSLQDACEGDHPEAFRNGGSMVFVRAVQGEADERFWHTVWETVGGDPAAFDEFCWSPSDVRRGELLARQMQRFHPSFDAPRRSPDVLVLCGTRTLPSKSAITTSPLGQFDLRTIVESAADILAGRPRSILRRHIGDVRVVVVPEAGVRQDGHWHRAGHLDRDLRGHLADLSVFRNGFSGEMARRLLRGKDGLRLSDAECADIMQRLSSSRDGHGRPFVRLGHSTPREVAEGSFEFFLESRAPLPGNPGERSALHQRACDAISGFLTRNELASRFDFSVSMSPAWLHEAQHHAGQARAWLEADLRAQGLAIERNYRVAALSQRATRLSRAGEPFALAAVRWITKVGLDVEGAILDDVLERLDRHGSRYPVHLALAARLASTLAKRAPAADRRAKFHARSVELLDEAEKLALQMAQHRATASDGRSHRFLVAVERCREIWERSRTVTDELVGAVRVSIDLLAGSREILWHDWFVLVGDLEPPGRERYAARFYRRGFCNERVKGVEAMRVPALLRWLGSHYLSRSKPLGEDWLGEAALGISEGQTGQLHVGIDVGAQSSARFEAGVTMLRDIRRRAARVGAPVPQGA